MSESKDAQKDNETNGFKNALFINPISCDSDLRIEDIQEGIEGMNLGIDMHLVKTPTSNEGRTGELNFNNLISSDLMKKLEASSPMKSNRTLKKKGKGNEEEEESEMGERQMSDLRGSDYSLFYLHKKQQEMDYKMNSMREEDIKENLPPFKSARVYEDPQHLSYKIPESQKIFNRNFFDGYVQNEKPRLKKCSNHDPISSSNLTELSEDVSYYPKNFMMNYQANNLNGYSQNIQGYPPNNPFGRHGQFQYSQSTKYPRCLNPSDEIRHKNEMNSNCNDNNNRAEVENPVNNNNRSYTMYGKTGWICSMCKNFNYENRVKCNRCGKPQMRPPMYPRSVQKTNMMINSNDKNSIDMYNQMVLMQNESTYLTFKDINKINHIEVSSANKMKQSQEITARQMKNTASNNCMNSGNSTIMNNMNMINNSNVNIFNPNTNVMKTSSNTSANDSPPLTNQNKELFTMEKEKDPQNGKKKKKPFIERIGDWVCIKCKNLNFSFRIICNRCQLTKIESEKMFEQYMKNLMNYVRFNEIIQNQLLTNNMGQTAMRPDCPATRMPGQSNLRIANSHSNFDSVSSSFNSFYPNKQMISNSTSPLFDVNSSKELQLSHSYEKYIVANKQNNTNILSQLAEYSTEGSNNNAYNSENFITEDVSNDKFSNHSK